MFRLDRVLLLAFSLGRTMTAVEHALATGLQHHRAGRLNEAEAVYRQILAIQPGHDDALQLLGAIAHQKGHDDLAVRLIERAIGANPNNPVAHSNLAEAYRALGRPAEALPHCHRATELRPEYAEAHNNLGSALQALGQQDAAIAAYQRALQIRPNYAQALNNLGVSLMELRQIDRAVATFRQVIQLAPQLSDAWNNFGVALQKQGLSNEAIEAHRRAVALRPDFADAHDNLGNVLWRQGQLDPAMSAIQSALKWKPDSADAYNHLGNILKDRGQIEEAIAAYRRAAQFRPADASIQSNLLYALQFSPTHDPLLLAEEIALWNRQFGNPTSPNFEHRSRFRASGRPMRIGYVSPDFRLHVVGKNLVPLFRNHDRRNFQIVCYSDVVKADDLTRFFHEYSTLWRDTLAMSDESLAAMIRQDEIDILVDLSQHLAGNRLPLFSHRAAPVQVSFAGYPASTGANAIGYRISDQRLETSLGGIAREGHPDSDSATANAGHPAAEQVHFIDSFWCFDPCGVSVEANSTPAIENGCVTFGSLNSFSKTNGHLLKLWSRVLLEVPNSRLAMLSAPGSHRQQTVDYLQQLGIAPHRVQFFERCPHHDYLELYRQLDIVLDTFPYNGHTTSLDALWMGVPVVSLCGDRSVSRAGLSQLSNLGLPELVAHSEEEYVKIAAALANDMPRLTELRSSLRQRMEQSVLMDGPKFARQIEEAYRAMWRDCCETEAAGS